MAIKYSKMLFFIFLFWLCSAFTANAGLIKKTVGAQGIGSSLNQAIYDALDEAIGRINGKSIETKKQLESVEISQVDGDKEDYYSSEMYKSNIKSATKGVVDSYDILSKRKNSDGLFEVTLSVTVVKFKKHNSNRKRIAIFPIRIGQGRFQINGQPINKKRAKRLLTQNLVTTLVQSRKFTVLDREYMLETLGEQTLITSENVPVEEMARLGQELVADYIMVGTLEDLGYVEKQIKMQSSGRTLTSRYGYVEIGIRLIDTATREIAYADFQRLRVTGFNGTSLKSNVDAGIVQAAANQIGRRILDTIYPLVVLSINGDNLTLGQGGSQIRVGDHLDVFMYGKRLTDPYTKEFIGREEIKVGELEIKRVNPKQSHAQMLTSTMDLSKEFEPKKFICRANFDGPKKEQVQREERRKKRAEKRKKKDDDW